MSPNFKNPKGKWMSSSESDLPTDEEIERAIANQIAHELRIYDKLNSKQELEYSSNLYEIAHRESLFWQQIYFDYFDFPPTD
jgi:hypothetical protein